MTDKMCNMGVIGMGLRAEYMIKNFAQFNMMARVSCICDLDIDGAKARLKTLNIDDSDIKFYTDYNEMMKTEKMDGIMLATNCISHTDIACDIMQYNVPIFLEKPVSILDEQLDKLAEHEKKYNPNVLVSFPLRATPLCLKAKEIIDSGVLGPISQFQAVNNVSYARVYYHTWFRDESLTGGLFLQKSTHDIDVIQFLLDDAATSVCAMESKVIFKGDKPKGLTCPECKEYRTCLDSSLAVAHNYFEHVDGDGCAFAVDTGNHDSATILMQFENGVHGVYSQNFVARKQAAKRMVRIIGYKATLEFDFVTGTIHEFHHVNGINETITVDTNGLNHFGGDKILAENFIGMMNGSQKSLAPLICGIDSAKACLMAKQSATEQRFVTR